MNIDITTAGSGSVKLEFYAVFASGAEVKLQDSGGALTASHTMLFCEKAGTEYSGTLGEVSNIVGGPIPVRWRIKTNHTDSNPMTYSVSVLSALERG